jgi:hypothetical protein
MDTQADTGTSGEQREGAGGVPPTIASQAVPGVFAWRPIQEAPRDGTLILGRRSYADRYTGLLRYQKRRTFWGKTSHVPLYGWNWGRDPEDQNLWSPTYWRPLPAEPILTKDEGLNE